MNREESETGTACKLWGTAGSETLNRVGPARWQSRTEPTGLCGVFNTVEFSCNPESLIQCEYFEHSTYTITTGESCEFYSTVQDQGDRYSWRVSERRDLVCDTIEFSYD